MNEKKGGIKFGTDGWRGVIAGDFTFETVRTVSQATADYLLSRGAGGVKGKQRVVVGYDTRFLSEDFALAAAGVVAGNGLKVILSRSLIPSPALAWSVVNMKANLGIMITASHNPPEYNGFKIKAESGSPADSRITGEIEKYLRKNRPKDSGGVTTKDLMPGYLEKLRDLVDINLIKRRRLRIVHDPMFGAGRALLSRTAGSARCRIFSIHDRPDPSFGGLRPEPIGKYLGGLAREVRKRRADIGVATDGDADRIGVVDNNGRYLTPNQVFPLILLYLAEEKKLKGKVVQTISLGYLGERIADFFGLPFQEVPVGFKYVAASMMAEDVLAGGEESGGFGHRNYIPERDGTLNSLILLEMLAVKRRKLSLICKDLQQRFGRSYYDRVDLALENAGAKKEGFKKELTEAIAKRIPGKIAGMKVREVRTYDGVKLILGSRGITGGEAWLLLRPSGTEPLVRVYAEADREYKMKKLLDTGKKIVHDCFRKDKK